MRYLAILLALTLAGTTCAEQEKAYRPLTKYVDWVRLYYRDPLSETSWLTRMVQVPNLPGMKPQACFLKDGDHIAKCFYVGVDEDGTDAVVVVPVLLAKEETV